MKGFWKKVWKFFKTPLTDHVKNLWEILHDFFTSPTRSRWYAIIGILIVVIALPVTVIVLQQRTVFFQRAYIDCTSDWVQCAGRTNGGTTKYCTNIDSTHQVHVYQPSRCTSPVTCIDLGASMSCGAKPTCPGGVPSGSFCTSSGICRGEAPDYYLNGSCGFGEVCCSPHPKPAPVTYTCTNPNDPNNRGIHGSDGGTTSCDTFSFCKGGSYTSTGSDLYGAKSHLCASTSSCEAGNHVFINAAGKYQLTSDASCAKYECTSGNVSIGGSCASGDSTCCISAKEYGGSNYQVQYKCIKPNDFDYTAVSGADGAVAYCGTLGSPANSFCTGGPYNTNSGITDALKHLCQQFTPTSCTCTSNDNPSNTSFSCNNGLIKRSCGTGLVCDNAANGIQGGLWPCIKPISTGKSVSCGPYNVGKCVFIDFHSGSNIKITTDPSIAEAYDKQSDLPTCSKISSSYVNVDAGSTCSSLKNQYGQPKSGEGPLVSECCAPSTYQLPSCTSVGGSCMYNGCPYGNFPKPATCGQSQYMQCCNPAPTTSTPTPTCDPAKQSCGGGGNPTPTPGGGGNPTPTPTPCSNGKDTKIALSAKLDGIGIGGFDNGSPKRPNRAGNVRVFDTANASGSISSSSQAFNFGKTKGNFDSTTIDLKTALSCGKTYKVEVKLPGYLPATADVKYGDTSQVIAIEPLPGDINEVDKSGIITGDGKIDINDYSIYRQCRNVDPNTTIDFKSGSTTVKVKCADLINFFDFQDGGTMENIIFTPSGGASVGEWDANYNLWLRSYLKTNGL